MLMLQNLFLQASLQVGMYISKILLNTEFYCRQHFLKAIWKFMKFIFILTKQNSVKVSVCTWKEVKTKITAGYNGTETIP